VSNPRFYKERQSVYSGVPYFYHDLDNEEYALLDICKKTEDEWNEIRIAAIQVGAIFDKIAPLLRALDDETLLQLGFPYETLAYCKIKSIPQEYVIGRLDFVVTNSAIKLLEFNADTPTFIKETFHANSYVCQHFGVENPNRNSVEILRAEMRKAIAASWNHLNRPGVPKIVFTSHVEHIEDKWTTRYIQEQLDMPSEYVSLDQLRIVTTQFIENGEVIEPGLFTPSGERIDILYRQTYPAEHLANDKEPTTGEDIGQALMNLVAQNQVMILNPPSSFLLQSKAVQVLIWGLHEEGKYFTETEHEIIERYFLPTYLEPDKFLRDNLPYVKKPSFGREGDTVQIFNGSGETINEEPMKTYSETLPVYQAFCPLPISKIQTALGEKQAHLMVGCFLLNKRAGAIGIRAGGAITNNESYFLPVGIE